MPTIRDLLAGLGSVVRGGQDLINRNLPQNTDLFNNALEGLTGQGYDDLSTQGQAAPPSPRTHSSRIGPPPDRKSTPTP